MTITAEGLSVPEAGDLVWVDLRPTRGREQSGVRPAVVLTDRDFHVCNEIAIICPITSNIRSWPAKVVLPPGLAAQGAVPTDQKPKRGSDCPRLSARWPSSPAGAGRDSAQSRSR